MPNAIVNFVLRGFNIIFASIVLGLSIGLMKGQWEGESSPVSLQFAAFVGAISLLGGFIGLAAEWVTILQGKIGLIIDGVITVMNIAGGVLLAIKIGGVKCSDSSPEYQEEHLANNDLFNGGCKKLLGEWVCLNWDPARHKYLNSRCRESQADSVFMFLTVAILLACGTMTFLRMKKGY